MCVYGKPCFDLVRELDLTLVHQTFHSKDHLTEEL